MSVLPESPLTEREERIIEANSALDECPECGRDVAAADLTDSGHLYVSHVDDEIGLDSRRDDSLKGCRVEPSNDPTL